MDLSFPLKYENGAIKTVSETSQTHVRHYIETIEGERLLSPSFGVDVSLLFSSELTELFEEKLRLNVNVLTNEQSLINISQAGRTVSIQITIDQNSFVIESQI